MIIPRLLSKDKLAYIVDKFLEYDDSLSANNGFIFHPTTGHLMKIEQSNGQYKLKHLQAQVPSANWEWDSFNFCTDVLS